MSWLPIAFIPPIANALVNHIDKYLLEQFIKGRSIGSLVIFSGLMGIPVALIIALLKTQVFNIEASHAILMIINGSLFMLAVVPYLYAMEKDEASIVAPLAQMITVISLILGYIFLNETLSQSSLLAFVFIISGSILLTIEFQSRKKVRFKKLVFIYMLITSFLMAVNGLVFKLVAQDLNFWTTTFWEFVGFVVFAIIVFSFVKSYRKEFLRVLRTNTVRVLEINGLNEVLATTGKISLHFATLLAPLSLVFLIAEGFQPFFVLLFGIIITIFFPKIAREDLSKRTLIQKLSAIILLFIGAYFAQLG